MRKSRRGFTLLELLVYSMLLGILLIAVYGVFSAAMRYFRFVEATSDLRGQAQQTLLRVGAELAESRGYTVRVSTRSLVFLSPRRRDGRYSYDACGNLQWHKWVWYSLDGQGRLTRSTVYLSTPVSTPPTLTTMSSPPSSATETEIIAQHITSLTFLTEPTGSSSPTTVRVSGTFERTVQSNAANTSDNRIDATTTVQMHN